ncbi:hypothetical protein VIGAN_08268800, partial [Vigna angularis var. angularis]
KIPQVVILKSVYPKRVVVNILESKLESLSVCVRGWKVYERRRYRGEREGVGRVVDMGERPGRAVEEEERPDER